MNTVTSAVVCSLFLLLASFPGCRAMEIRQFEQAPRRLELEQFFLGTTRGYGQIWSGDTLRRQFTVDINGYHQDGLLILDEQFRFDDGQEVRRQWRIRRDDAHQLRAFADDVEGDAEGEEYGNAVRWSYKMTLEKFTGSSMSINFDDWMFRQSDEILLNRARLTKLGLPFGEMIVVFTRTTNGLPGGR